MWEICKYLILVRKIKKLKNLKMRSKSGMEPPFIHTTHLFFNLFEIFETGVAYKKLPYKNMQILT